MNRDDDDAVQDDFAAAMQDVAPLKKNKQSQRVARDTAKAPTAAQLKRRKAALGLDDEEDPNFLTLGEVPSLAPLEYVEWKKDGVQNGVFEKLKRGEYPLDASLDLHRKTVKEARHLVFAFLARASARHHRHVAIAHGKGELSQTPGRLKSYVVHWLSQHPEVIAYCSAIRQMGGVGSVFILLRKSRDSREHNREAHGQKTDHDSS